MFWILLATHSVPIEALKKPMLICVTDCCGQHFVFEGICMQTASIAEWVVSEIRKSYSETDLIRTVLKMSPHSCPSSYTCPFTSTQIYKMTQLYPL